MKLTRVLVLMVITLFALAYGASHYFPRDEKPTVLGNENSNTPRDQQPAPPSSSSIGNMTFTYAYNGGNCSGCVFILAHGTIAPNTPDVFRNFLDNLEKEEGSRQGLTIYLNSPGGSISGAIRLGDLIRTNNLNTAVGHAQKSADPADGGAYEFLDSASCNSACVLSFVGGVHRFYRAESEDPPRWYVGSGSQTLILRGLLDDIVHERGRLDRKDYLNGIQDGLKSSGGIIEYLSRMGLNPSAIFDGLNSTESSDNILTEAQAHDLKITNTPPPPLVWVLTQARSRLELRTNSVIENHPVGYRFLCTSSNHIRISLIIEIQNIHYISMADIRSYFRIARWKSDLAKPYGLDIPAQIIRSEIQDGLFQSEIAISQDIIEMISGRYQPTLEFDLPSALSRTFPTLKIHSPDLMQVLPQLTQSCPSQQISPKRIRR